MMLAIRRVLSLAHASISISNDNATYIEGLVVAYAHCVVHSIVMRMQHASHMFTAWLRQPKPPTALQSLVQFMAHKSF